METATVNQLELELPVEYKKSDGYKIALAEYMSQNQNGLNSNNVYLVYCSSNKRFFVSKFFKKETVESYKTFRILQ